MTNPNNALGTNGAFGGRTSVNAFNDLMNMLGRGIISGFEIVPSSGMMVNVGGVAGTRDTAAAQDASGNKTSINNRTTSPIAVEMSAASTTATRHDVIVAYVDSPASVSETVTDNPSICGIIPVAGSSTAAPTEAAIRTAITTDGASGASAYYAVLGELTIPASTTTITSDMIAQSDFMAQINPTSILPDSSVTSSKIDWTSFATGAIKTSTHSATTDANGLWGGAPIKPSQGVILGVTITNRDAVPVVISNGSNDTFQVRVANWSLEWQSNTYCTGRYYYIELN